MDLALNNLQRLICHKTQTTNQNKMQPISTEGQDPANKSPVNDTKPFDSEAPVMLEFWGMQRTPSLSTLPDPLW